MVSSFRLRINLPIAGLLVVAACTPAFAGKEVHAGPHDRVVPNQLLVNVLPGADISQLLSAIAPQATATALRHAPNTFVLNVPAGLQELVSHLLAASPLVNYVEPNRIRSTTTVPPNDTSISSQWNLTIVQAMQAWSHFPGQYFTAAAPIVDRVKVAILDTGVDCTHPDFMNAGGTSTDAAHGGQIDWADSVAIQPTAIKNPTCAWQDDYGHGTHVAGIVAAATNNATGVASLGYPLQLVIMKTSNSSGEATDGQVAEGIYDAIDAGAQVISMSLGGIGYSLTMQQAMDAAWESNVLVVAAAGNSGGNDLVYPGAGNHVLGVGATDVNNQIASFSTWGNWVRIAAPGVGILSTLPTYNGPPMCCNYGYEEGTSMATPHVAALAGLLYAANPGISAASVAQRIQQTAQASSGWNQYTGYGVINAGAALDNVSSGFAQGALTGQVTDANGIPLSNAVVTATGGGSYTTASQSGNDNGLFRINLNPGTYPVTVTATGYPAVNTQAVVLAGADTMLTFRMGSSSSYGTVSGVVTYNGAGVAGAVVEAAANNSNLILGTAITDPSGNYSVSVPSGTYTLTASAPGYLNVTSSSHTLAANGTVTVNLALNALGTLTGTVTDLTGLPVANASVVFAGGAFIAGATTNASGAYSTGGIPAGTYTVTASASGFTPVSIGSVSVTTNTSTLVNLQFTTGVSLSSGLIGYWPFNEGAGTIGHDISGGGNNAGLSNINWTTGLLYTYAVNFNVNESYALVPSVLFNGPFSVSVWVNSAASQVGGASLVQANANPNWFLGLDNTGTKYKFFVNGGTGSSGTCNTSNIPDGCAQGGSIATGWHLVTATYDSYTALLYVDSTLVASDTFTTSSVNAQLQMAVNWGGAMQSVRIYDRVLTAPEVAALYSQASNASLSLTKTADAAAVTAGASIGYTLTAGNAGTVTAQTAALSDPLPTGTGVNWTISPAYTGPGTCAIAGATLSCSFGSLTPGASASVHVSSGTGTASCGLYSNTATASAGNAPTTQASANTTVQCGQTISFGTLSNQPFGIAPFTVSASASSLLPVSFASQTTSTCTVSGSTVTLVSPGACTIQATQAGNSIYLAASPVNQSFTVTQATQTITFGGLSNRALGSGTFTVSATASSNLAVSFNSQTTATCTVSGTTVSLVAAGLCTIQATQSGNTAWLAASPVNQSFTVTQGTQTITFGGLSNQVFGSGTFTVSASASSNLAVSFNSLTTATCTVSGSTVSLVAVGQCIIQATQPGNATWLSASPVDQSFNITQGTQTISFGTVPNVAFGSGAFNLTATASSTLTVTYASLPTSVCTVSGSTVTLVAVGQCIVQATQPGNTNWLAATPVNQTFNITQGSQTISFGTLPNVAFGSAAFNLTATASSTLTVTYASLPTSVCTVSGSTVTLVAVGQCIVQATQPGNTNWLAATPVNQTFNITQGSQTISFGTLPNVAFGSAAFNVSATATSNLAVSFASLTTSTCTVSGSTVSLVGAGPCTIQATQIGNANWFAATAVNQSFNVTQGAQTISFPALPNVAFGSAAFNVSATATSNLAVSFASLTTSTCTVSGSTVSLVAAGPCTIQATQIGNANWFAATAVNQSFNVTQGAQTISFAALPNVAFGSGAFNVSATATSNLAVSFASLTTSTCTVSGSTVTLVAAGPCTIQATQIGNANWFAATAVNQSFNVTQGAQTISFPALSNHAFGSGTFNVAATATSQLPVSFTSLTTATCTVSGSTVSLAAVGPCTIQATQSGNTNWTAAQPVNQSFNISQGTQTIAFGSLPNVAVGSAAFNVSATATSQLSVSFTSQTLAICTVSGATVTLVAVGQCTIQAMQSGNTNWMAAQPVSQSFNISQGTQTIAFGSLPNVAVGSGTFTVTATATSQLAVSFNSQTSATCTVSGATVTLVAAGLCTIQATQSGNANYSAANPVTQSFNISQGTQTITFNSLSSQPFGATPFTVIATATSQLPVSFTSLTTATCTVSGATVTLVAAGLCTIQATQSGNANYSAANPVTQSFNITQGTQTITFNSLSSQPFGATPFTVSATATSQLPVSFTSQTSAICTVSGATVTLVAAGLCTIQATQSGNANYSAATPVTQTFSVTQATQSIDFPAIANQALGTPPFSPIATASSNLTVSLTSQTTAICTVSNTTVTLVAIGTCAIQATQAGNSNYTAAQPVSQTFTVTAGIGAAGSSSLSFPNTLVGSSSAVQTFNFQNTGNTALTITGIAPAGPDAAQYRYSADAVLPCPISPSTLRAGAACTLDVTFAPLLQGAHNNAQIAITDNSGNITGSTQSIGLTGMGIVLSSIAISAANGQLASGISEQFTATGTYSDNSTANITSLAAWASSAQGVAGVNAGGLATAQLSGQTNITASLSGVTSNSFQLTVVGGAASSVAVSAGSGQSALVGTAFPASLQALVKDGAGNALSNVPVTFTAPASGASGTFANGLTTVTVSTNSFGVAIASAFTANGISGNYSVTAGASGVPGAASFSLTNLKNPSLTISESPVGAFVQGQSAAYTVTVTNAANAGATSGTITVTESAPPGLTLTGLDGGSTWNCSVASATCTTNTVFGSNASSSITVTVAVAANAPASVSNIVSVSGGASQSSSTSYSTPIAGACLVTQGAGVSVYDVQQIINQALGTAPPRNDPSGGGIIGIVDVQIVTNAVLSGSCTAM